MLSSATFVSRRHGYSFLEGKGGSIAVFAMMSWSAAMYFAEGLLWRDQDSRPTASACLEMDTFIAMINFTCLLWSGKPHHHCDLDLALMAHKMKDTNLGGKQRLDAGGIIMELITSG